MQVKDCTIVLTGASGGIGSSLARVFALAGARLILVGRHAAQLESLRSELPVLPLPHLTVTADLLTEQGREQLVHACKGLDIHMLVNNAGLSDFHLLENSDPATISAMVNLNTVVPMLLTQQLLPQLRMQKRAAIVNIGSAFGSIGYPGFSVYCASKFGLRGFSEALRRELIETNVRVLHVAPRATHTTMNSDQVVAMNRVLGNATDDPLAVAAFILQRIDNERWGSCVIGWPERLYALINSILPALTDRTLRRQLPVIRHFLAPQSTMGESI
ncbi:MAG: SDR family oxidoreductase [Pseudohongiellaceae bacterium]